MVKVGDRVIYQGGPGSGVTIAVRCTVTKVLTAAEVHQSNPRLGPPGEQFFVEVDADDGSHSTILPVSVIKVISS